MPNPDKFLQKYLKFRIPFIKLRQKIEYNVMWNGIEVRRVKAVSRKGFLASLRLFSAASDHRRNRGGQPDREGQHSLHPGIATSYIASTQV